LDSVGVGAKYTEKEMEAQLENFNKRETKVVPSGETVEK
jgi:hypothetical protein